jgi:hypothetical protein
MASSTSVASLCHGRRDAYFIFYMFTPLQVALITNIDWQIFRISSTHLPLDESGLRALLLVGVNPGFVNSTYVIYIFQSFIYFPILHPRR